MIMYDKSIVEIAIDVAEIRGKIHGLAGQLYNDTTGEQDRTFATIVSALESVQQRLMEYKVEVNEKEGPNFRKVTIEP